MPQEYVKGFVVAQDSVHGKLTWKVRVQQKGHEYDGRKCRVMSLREGFVPNQGTDVVFVIGSTVEGGQKILLAFDVSPFVEKEEREVPVQDADVMNWFVTEMDGELFASCVGDADQHREDLEMSEDEKVVAFVPFNIEDHLSKYDEPDTEGAFEIIRALSYVPATREALEKLITAVVREALKAKA